MDLADTKSTLHTLEEQEEGLTAFSPLEETTSEFDLDDDKHNDRSVNSNYCSSHDTLEEKTNC